MPAAEEAVQRVAGEPVGMVRATCPPGLAAETIAGSLPEFFEAFPQVRVQLHVGARPVDLIEEHFDVGVRVRTTFQGESDLVIKRIGPVHGGLVASPAFLARHGTPQHLDDLRQLPTVGLDEEHHERSGRWSARTASPTG